MEISQVLIGLACFSCDMNFINKLFLPTCLMHVCLTMTLICCTHDIILDLIDNIPYSRPRKYSTCESNALLLQCICYDTDKLPDGMPASPHVGPRGLTDN